MHLVDGEQSDETPLRPDLAGVFRGEALAQYQRGRESEAHLLELEPKWARYTSRVILALFAAALLFTALVHVDRYASGIGVVRGGRLIAVVPARHARELRPSMPLRFEFAEQQVPVAYVGNTLIAPSEARRILGADGASRWTSTDPAVRVEAPLAASNLGDGVAGSVRIRVGRERLLRILWSRRG